MAGWGGCSTGRMRRRRWGPFLRGFRFGHVRQLDAVACGVLANLTGEAPLLQVLAELAFCTMRWQALGICHVRLTSVRGGATFLWEIRGRCVPRWPPRSPGISVVTGCTFAPLALSPTPTARRASARVGGAANRALQAGAESLERGDEAIALDHLAVDAELRDPQRET